MTTSFRAYGSPAPKGSTTAIRPGLVLEGRNAAQRQRIEAWRQDVVAAARAAHEGPPLSGPLRVQIDFRMRRPKANRHGVWSAVAPDIDKLARHVNDSLTAAGVIHDDRMIVELVVTKRLADAVDPWTGADITVAEIAGPA